ncbi:MAG: nickel pincer cofactor biosynthesis protein LarB [Nitrospirae bacterium]|nr:nickel pincer cofactor biosynthesis protein LarB [Nitrospirota bacterium]
MDREKLEALLRRVRGGKMSVEKAVHEFGAMPIRDLGFAQIDTHRAIRKGFPEVIWGAGKTAEQIVRLLRAYQEHRHDALVTRVDPKKAVAVRRRVAGVSYDKVARVLTLRLNHWRRMGRGVVAVVAAGTSDLPVAEEAAVTAHFMGNDVERHFDVGVAGVHRLLRRAPAIMKARVVIVVAGMEGALPSVVGGLVSAPVIAVPTSVGYGASFSGLTALLAMMTSCAPGIGVVNIDNGFGAGYLAAVINRM